MPRLPRTAACLVVALFAFSSTASGVEPQAVVSSVAQAIEDNYFDADRGKRIADELRAEMAQGRFDAIEDPKDLATALTSRLSPLDSHFAVRWSASGAPLPPTHAAMIRRRQSPDDAGSAPVPGGRHVIVSSPADAAAGGAAPSRVRHGPASVDDPSRRSNFGIRRVEVWPGNIGYIELREFANFAFGDPDAPARRAIEAALQLVAHADAVIIDLRMNGGGSPAMVGYLTSAFTPKGANIYNTFRSRHGTDSEAPADWYPQPRLDVPLYVLTSARTGSAAEAFAYTLKNAKRATLVGDATGGAANPGGFVDVGQGFAVFVSSGSPVSPITGGNWEGTGVAPDVVVAAEDAQEKALGLALAASLARAPHGKELTDVRWALESHQARVAAPPSESLAEYAGGYDPVSIEARGDALFLRRGRRPALLLQSLGEGLFALDADPGQRVRFERGDGGKVVALESLSADGHASRYTRVGASR